MLEDKVRTDRRLPPLNPANRLANHGAVDLTSQLNKEAKRDYIKFKTKEEEQEYIDETKRVLFDAVKRKLIDSVLNSAADYNTLLLSKNLKQSSDKFCVDTIDKLKRKALSSTESIENKRVLLYTSVYLQDGIKEMNMCYKTKYDYDSSAIPFKGIAEGLDAGIYIPEPILLESSTNQTDTFNASENIETQNSAKQSTLPQMVKQPSTALKQESTSIPQNDKLENPINSEAENLKGGDDKKLTEITLKHIDPKSLQTLINTLTAVTNRLPKYVLLLVTIKYPNNVTVRCDLTFLAEYLHNELETQIHAESGPVIEDFANRIENEEFEDSSIIFIKNYDRFESYSNFESDKFGLKRCKLWKGQEAEFRILQAYADIYLEDDSKNNIWEYKPQAQAYTIPKLIGPEIGKGLEFVQKLGPNFTAFKNREQWPSQMLILGGEFTYDKLEFLVNFSDFFDLLILVGRFGLMMSLASSQLDLLGVNTDIKKAIQYSKDLIKTSNYKIRVPNAYVVTVDSELLLDFDKTEFYGEEYVQLLSELYNEDSETQKFESDCESNFISLDELTAAEATIRGSICDIGPLVVDELAELINEHEKVWLFDSLSLNARKRYGLANEYLIECLHKEYRIFDIDPASSELKSKLSICGADIVSQLNQYNYYKKKKTIDKMEARKEKEARKKHKTVQFDSDDEENENDEESADSNALDSKSGSDTGSELSDQEDVIENTTLITNNTFNDTAYVLKMLNGRQSDGNFKSDRIV